MHVSEQQGQCVAIRLECQCHLFLLCVYVRSEVFVSHRVVCAGQSRVHQYHSLLSELECSAACKAVTVGSPYKFIQTIFLVPREAKAFMELQSNH